jgi:hypothetical protein
LSFSIYGILIIFGIFILLLIINPNLSCFGRKLKSPLYPILRKRKLKKKKIETQDYGFELGGDHKKKEPEDQIKNSSQKKIKTQDYGFNLGEGSKEDKNK